jgi:shikimate kinase
MVEHSIILIGMPGSGKTTIGAIVGRKLNCPFFDMDEMIMQMTGRSIDSLFLEGEETFRDAESAACKRFMDLGSVVIACGGGVILRQSNIKLLKKAGSIIFIDRPADKIAIDIKLSKRPLLKDGIENLYKLYEDRYSLYKNAADFIICNDGTAYQAAEKIIDLINREGKK